MEEIIPSQLLSKESIGETVEAEKENRDIEKEKKHQDFDVKQKIKKYISYGAMGMLLIMAGVLVWVVSSWVLNITLPVHFRWLSPAEADNLKELLGTATLGIIFSEYTRRVFQ